MNVAVHFGLLAAEMPMHAPTVRLGSGAAEPDAASIVGTILSCAAYLAYPAFGQRR